VKQAPDRIDLRYEMIRAYNALGDLLDAKDAAGPYARALAVAESAPPGDRNVWDLRSRAECNLRWPLWNPSAPAAERRARLEAALQGWERLAAQAPANQRVRATLAKVRAAL
jgi:hypothetical protein